MGSLQAFKLDMDTLSSFFALETCLYEMKHINMEQTKRCDKLNFYYWSKNCRNCKIAK